MNNFMVLHFKDYIRKGEVIVNVSNINAIYPSRDGGSQIFMMNDNSDPVVVMETPSEVMNLILSNK